jgi:DNA-binding transcriptional regulator YiaG
MMSYSEYRYDECGLDDVILVNLPEILDDAGEACIHIANINALHRAILRGVVEKNGGLSPKELRFVRTELGLTQAELAQVVGKDAQTIGRWERGEHPIEASADTIVRVMALQSLGDCEAVPPIADLAKRSVPTAQNRPIMIDARDPNDYKMVA